MVSNGRSILPSNGTSSSYGPAALRIAGSSALRRTRLFSDSAVRPSPSSIRYRTWLVITARLDGVVLPAIAAPLIFPSESRRESFHRERARSAADVDLDARQLPPLLGVVRRRAEQLGHLRQVGRHVVELELHAGDDLRRRAGRGEEVEQLRAGRAHRQAAGKRRRELVHAEHRDVTAHGGAGQVDALRRSSAVELREQSVNAIVSTSP